MKRNLRIGVAAGISAVLCGIFLTVLMLYMKPIGGQNYDWSVDWKAAVRPDNWVYDQKGWEVFTQQGENRTELQADGDGGFTGLSALGQTVYFSRVLREDLPNATLRVQKGENACAVFLGDDLLYTDCPDLDNRVGYLHLPLLEWAREGDIVVTLPPGYLGKTLTIAQATSPVLENEYHTEQTVYLANVTLSSGFAHESRLISESFGIAVPAALGFAAGVLLLGMFVWQSVRRRPNIALLCAALVAFLWMADRMVATTFYYNYFGLPGISLDTLPPLVLLVFFATKLSGWRRIAGWCLGAAQVGVAVADFIFQRTEGLTLEFIRLSPLAGVVGLLGILAFGFLEWKQGRRFWKLFCILAPAGILLYGGIVAVMDWPLFVECWQQLTEGCFIRPLYQLQMPMMAAGFLCAAAEFFYQEISQHMETRLLVQRSELSQKNYESMQRQHEQILMLRHDMDKHIHLLRRLSHEESVTAYLDELIGEQKTIHPVLQSGNETVDILLNGKLQDALQAGVRLDIINATAPSSLPMTEKDLCALLMNIMENATAAACAPGVADPYIRLDLHISGNFFVFACENSFSPKPSQTEKEPGKDVFSQHGLGLKIMRQIAGRYDTLLETESGEGRYTVTVAVPLT